VHQVRSVARVITVVHFPAHDLAPVEIQDQVQVEPLANHGRGQVSHIPAPDLAWGRRDVHGRRSPRLRRLGPAAIFGLPVRTQHSGKARLAGKVHALVGQRGHDARWRHVGKARLVGHAQHMRTFRQAQSMGGPLAAPLQVCHRRLPGLRRPASVAECARRSRRFRKPGAAERRPTVP